MARKRRLAGPFLPLLVCAALAACDPGSMVDDLFGGGAATSSEDPEGQIDDMARALGFQPGPEGTYTYEGSEGLAATIEADGRVAFPEAGGEPFAGPADFALRGDPNTQAGAKQAELIAATADLRKAISIRWYDDTVDRSLEGIDHELESILRSEHIGIEQRREMIFERWDEADSVLAGFAAMTAESALGSVESKQAAASRTVRTRIEEFIRKKLPEGGADAYRPDELERLNARRKHSEPFAPYGESATVG